MFRVVASIPPGVFCPGDCAGSYEEATAVTLSADPEVPYDHLISAMDAVRGEDDELFPDVLLSAGVR